MKLRSLIVVVALSLASFAAHANAQTGLYLNPVAMHITNSVADKGTYAFLGQNSTAQTFWGVNFGAYYDFKTAYPFKAGLELRDSDLHGSGAALNNFLVGVRFSGKPFDNPLKLYIEPVVGVGSSKAPFTAIRISKVEYGGFAGVDYETHHHVDFRLVEIGYASLITASSETIGASDVIPASNILSISTGLVFRFP
jgi:hypothetical protein